MPRKHKLFCSEKNWLYISQLYWLTPVLIKGISRKILSRELVYYIFLGNPRSVQKCLCSNLTARGARLTSVTLRMEPFSAFLIGIFLWFGWSGIHLRIWITCSDGLDIFKYLMLWLWRPGHCPLSSSCEGPGPGQVRASKVRFGPEQYPIFGFHQSIWASF